MPREQLCSTCNYSGPGVSRDSGECYECTCARHGKPVTEEHHIAGRKYSDVVAEIPGNLHREIHARDADIPDYLKDPPRDRVMLVIARMVRALRNAGEAIVDVLTWIEVQLTQADAALVRLHGEQYGAVLMEGSRDG